MRCLRVGGGIASECRGEGGDADILICGGLFFFFRLVDVQDRRQEKRLNEYFQ